METGRFIDVICEDDVARRELLWLRAKEKGDAEMAALLEDVDPELPARLREVDAEIRLERDERERREAYGRAFDACFERHAARLGRRPL